MTSRAKAIFNSSAAQDFVNSSVYLIQGETKKEQKKMKWGEEVTKGLFAAERMKGRENTVNHTFRA